MAAACTPSNILDECQLNPEFFPSFYLRPIPFQFTSTTLMATSALACGSFYIFSHVCMGCSNQSKRSKSSRAYKISMNMVDAQIASWELASLYVTCSLEPLILDEKGNSLVVGFLLFYFFLFFMPWQISYCCINNPYGKINLYICITRWV